MKIEAQNNKGEYIILMVTEGLFLPVIDENGFDFVEVNLYWNNIQREDCIWFDKDRKKGYKPCINKNTKSQNQLNIDKNLFHKVNDLYEYIKLAKL